MFTREDICAIAVQIEHNGEATYLRAADRVREPAMAELLRWMAKEEARHARIFAAIGGCVYNPQGVSEAERMGRSLLQEMVKEQTFALDADKLAETGDIPGFLRQSVAFEEDTILFYQFLADLVEDEAVRQQLAAIIDEERRHIEMLNGMGGDGHVVRRLP